MHKLIIATLLTGCLSEEAPKVSLPVGTSASVIPAVTTDLGYTVQLSSIRIAVSTVEFTIEGEEHSAATARFVGPPPHPGHSAGGEVTGELPGNFVLTWNGQEQPVLGTGTLIVGTYRGANFRFRAADTDDAAATDPLVGHAFHLVGSATKDGTTRDFTAQLDVEVDTAVIGAPFEAEITETSTQTLAFVFNPVDPHEGDTAFDGVDFFALSEAITPGSTAHNIIRRSIQTHDHYAVVAQ